MTPLVELARELVSIPSPAGHERAAVERCAEEMHTLGFTVSIDEAGNALGTVGDGRPRLLFDGHIDTVAPASGWTYPPFAAAITNGKLYGVGAVDMKGPIASMIHGVARAANLGRLGGTVGVSISTMEEVAEGAALQPVVNAFRPDAVVIGEPSGLQLMVAQRGRAEVVIQITGRAAHAAFPEEGANAILAAAAVLSSLEDRVQPESPELGRGILVPTEILSEPQPGISVVPSACRIRLDRRTLLGETERDVLAELGPHLLAATRAGAIATAYITESTIATYTGVKLTSRRFLPAWHLSDLAPLRSGARDALRAELGSTPVSAYPFCTNGSLTAGTLSIPTIGFGPGVTRRAHQPNECVDLDDLELGARGFAALASMRLHLAATMPAPR